VRLPFCGPFQLPEKKLKASKVEELIWEKTVTQETTEVGSIRKTFLHVDMMKLGFGLLCIYNSIEKEIVQRGSEKKTYLCRPIFFHDCGFCVVDRTKLAANVVATYIC